MNHNIERQIDELLLKIGIRSKLKGKKYLRVAISIIVSNSDTKLESIYWSISKLYNVTRGSVERAIRHSIEDVFMTADQEKIYEFFGNMVNVNSGKVTNATFIHRCAEIIKEDTNGTDTL